MIVEWAKYKGWWFSAGKASTMKMPSVSQLIASICTLTLSMVGCSGGGNSTSGGITPAPPTASDVAVTDWGNNRVLIYKTPISNHQKASIVIGQPDFTSNLAGTSSTALNGPSVSRFDASGNLWVTEISNNRVLEFRAPLTTGMAASVVLGQTKFTSGAAGTTSSTFDNPSSAIFDSTGHMWVTDFGNSRILRFTPPFVTGMAADLVLGQTDFSSNACGYSPPPTSQLCNPWQAAFDAKGNLWVSDYSNCRIVGYAPPFSTGMAASIAIGQEIPSNSVCFMTSASTFEYPMGIAFDSVGNLWVADSSNNRVLEFQAPLTTGMSATMVLGQSNFTDKITNIYGNITASMLDGPSSISFDSAGSAYVGDELNNRVLFFNPPFSIGMSASKVLGQPDFVSVGRNNGGTLGFPSANSLAFPGDVTTR